MPLNGGPRCSSARASVGQSLLSFCSPNRPGDAGAVKSTLEYGAARMTTDDAIRPSTTKPGPWQAHLERAREHAFVGRSAEQALWTRALGNVDAPAMLWVHGSTGIGKTTLLRRFARLASEADVEPIWLDARSCGASPDAFMRGLRHAIIGVDPGDLLTVLHEGPRRVLLLDNAEALRGLEAWLRERFLPSLPELCLVCVASRRAPDAEWLTELGWGALVQVVRLTNFSTTESDAWLSLRGVEPALHARLFFESGGHPLALSLLAAAAGQAAPPNGVPVAHCTDVFRGLATGFAPEPPDEQHRSALYACAHARTLDEATLRVVVLDPEAHERARALYDWLAGLSFVEESPDGLSLHEIAASAIDAELRTRDRARYRALHVALRDARLAELQTAVPAQRQRIALELIWLHRFAPVFRRWTLWEASRSLYASPAASADHRDILEVTRKFEGPACERAVASWLELQPEAFALVRDRTDRPVAYVMSPLIDRRNIGAAACDPRMQAALAHCERVAPMREDESIALVNWLDFGTISDPTASFAVASMQLVLFFLNTPRLSWSFVPIQDRERWLPLMSYIGHQPGPEIDTGEKSFLLCAHDWRAVATSTWLDRLTHDRGEPDPGVRGAYAPPVLTRESFAAALRAALQAWERPAELAHNPLLRARLVRAAAPTASAETALRAHITGAVRALANSARHAHYAAALEVTYLRPAPNQERAAERLGLPFSTYRRHLGRGLTYLTDALWLQELDAR